MIRSLVFGLCALASSFVFAAETTVIAHRGASAYLPEHSREAYLLAYGQGADYLEPDLVLSADGTLIALHDKTLDATTNVAQVFPKRARDDGHFYAIDFHIDELRRLSLRERIEPATGAPRFPDRWPSDQGQFQLVTFEELIELTRELNRSTGRQVGLYPELKFPTYHAEHDQDITQAVIEILTRENLPAENLPIFIQCFEPVPLRAIHQAHGKRFDLIQLIGENSWDMNQIDYDAMRSRDGLKAIASYAVGIGPPLTRLIEGPDTQGKIAASQMLKTARELSLEVHPFTFRREGLPQGLNLEDLLKAFMGPLAIEGVFTDNPDLAISVRESLRQ